MNRRIALIILVGVVIGLGSFVRVWMALNDHAYHPPVFSTQIQPVPRDQGIADAHKAAEEKAKAKKWEPPAYRQFPVVGSRVAVWVVAQLHLMFAAFVLAVPMFAFIIELIGYFDGRQALRRARLRVHQAAVDFVFVHRELRRVPDVPADHALPRLHELPDGGLLLDVPSVRPACSSSRRASSTATTTGGESFTRWFTSSSASASTSSARRSCSSPTPGHRS